jgi:hypothetical protein
LNPRAQVTYIRDVCLFMSFLGIPRDISHISGMSLYIFLKGERVKVGKMTNVLLVSGSGNLKSG